VAGLCLRQSLSGLRAIQRFKTTEKAKPNDHDKIEVDNSGRYECHASCIDGRMRQPEWRQPEWCRGFRLIRHVQRLWRRHGRSSRHRQCRRGGWKWECGWRRGRCRWNRSGRWRGDWRNGRWRRLSFWLASFRGRISSKRCVLGPTQLYTMNEDPARKNTAFAPTAGENNREKVLR